MKVAVIVSTYNRPRALALCLESIRRQTMLPDEVIVADDGSTSETADLLKSIAADFPVPVRHVWQPDEGFQLAKIRNRAIASTDADYIIQIDGDIVLHRGFIKDHVSIARRGFYVFGSRIRLNEKFTSAVEAAGVMPKIYPWSKGIINKREKAVYIPVGRLFSHHYKRNKATGLGCNIAFWRDDFIRINGYDEAFVGWGCEDTDLSMRLDRSGVQNYKMFGIGIIYHLWHKEADKSRLSESQAYMLANKDRAVACEKGINQYLTAETKSTASK